MAMKIKHLFIWLLLIFLMACTSAEKKVDDPFVFYTCSMDPQVMEKKPGRCPICKMDLTRIKIDPNQNQEEIKLSDRQIKLANIGIRPVEAVLFGKEKILNATITENENLTKSFASRMNGRIEKLYVQFIGQKIEKGDKLYDMYSQDLLQAEREYLMAFENEKAVSENGLHYSGFLKSALNRLLLFGFDEQQLKKLESDGQASAFYTVLSESSGVITSLNITQGDQVEEGQELFKVSDLSSLWVEAELFGNEILQVKNNTEVKITFPGFPGKTVFSKIAFMSPEMLPGSRINLIRAEISNVDLNYQPGMLALLSFRSGVKKTIAIPSDALVMDEKENRVWLQIKKGVYRAQRVEIGIQGVDSIEVVSGISQGDTLVVSGVYLLNSEYSTRKGNRFTKEYAH